MKADNGREKQFLLTAQAGIGIYELKMLIRDQNRLGILIYKVSDYLRGVG